LLAGLRLKSGQPAGVGEDEIDTGDDIGQHRLLGAVGQYFLAHHEDGDHDRAEHGRNADRRQYAALLDPSPRMGEGVLPILSNLGAPAARFAVPEHS